MPRWPSTRGSGRACDAGPSWRPGHAPVDAVGRTARLAAARIEAGALNDEGSLESLARELGLSSRQLRRAIRQEFGVSPIALAQTRRLLLAKQLLTETSLPLIEVAARQRLRERPPVQCALPVALRDDALAGAKGGRRRRIRERA